MSSLILLFYSLSPTFTYRTKKAAFYRRLRSQAASARIRAKPGSPSSWVDIQTTMLFNKKGGFCPDTSPKATLKEREMHINTDTHDLDLPADVMQKIIQCSRKMWRVSRGYSPTQGMGALVMDLPGSTCPQFVK